MAVLCHNNGSFAETFLSRSPLHWRDQGQLCHTPQKLWGGLCWCLIQVSRGLWNGPHAGRSLTYCAVWCVPVSEKVWSLLPCVHGTRGAWPRLLKERLAVLENTKQEFQVVSHVQSSCNNGFVGWFLA